MGKLTIRDVDPKRWLDAVHIAHRFASEYPDRMGFGQLVVYAGNASRFIAYRTKTGITVRGEWR